MLYHPFNADTLKSSKYDSHYFTVMRHSVEHLVTEANTNMFLELHFDLPLCNYSFSKRRN